MKVIDKSVLFNLLPEIGIETNNHIPEIDLGGCGLYAILIGAISSYDLFIPVADVGRNPKTWVNANTLFLPPHHILLLFKHNDKEYLYDSEGFKNVTNENFIAENTEEFDMSNHSHVKISWESLIETAQEPTGWNKDFNRKRKSSKLVKILYKYFNPGNNHGIVPDSTAVEDFMAEFRL